MFQPLPFRGGKQIMKLSKIIEIMLIKKKKYKCNFNEKLSEAFQKSYLVKFSQKSEEQITRSQLEVISI